ncbi:MAG: cytochrome c [Gammaproteobacteria bacterium]|jgi:cytochrome c
MCSRNLARAFVVVGAVAHAMAVLAAEPALLGAGVPTPAFGQAVAEQALEKWKITVFPDGTGLPSGSGSVNEGAGIYAMRCASCHGPTGEGVTADRLVGGRGTLASPSPVRTVGSFWPYATTLFDYVRRSMPYDAPKSLTSGEVYALTAYLLFLNGIVEDGTTLDAASLAKVRMPNRGGFVGAYEGQ